MNVTEMSDQCSNQCEHLLSGTSGACFYKVTPTAADTSLDGIVHISDSSANLPSDLLVILLAMVESRLLAKSSAQLQGAYDLMIRCLSKIILGF